MDDTKENGVTFAEICKVIWKRIWIVAIVTLTLAVVAFLGAKFLYNPGKSTYSVTFILNYPNSDAKKYPDGSPFFFQDIVSEERLAAAKEADKSFAKIDIEKLLEEDGISIEEETRERNGDIVPTGKYIITAESGYFSDKKQGTQFLSALVGLAQREVVEIAEEMNYRLDESAFNDADYSGKLDLLLRQKDSLISEYDYWISLYNSNYAVDGKSLVNHRAEVETIFGAALRDSLSTELSTNGYVPLELVENRRELLTAEKERNDTQIEELKNLLKLSGTGSSLEGGNLTVFDFSERLSALTTRNVEIEIQLEKLTEANIRKFESRLNEVYTTLQEAADKVHEVGVALCGQETRAYLDTTQAQEEGGISSILAAVLGALVGFLLASLIVYLVEIPKSRRSGNAAACLPAPEMPDAAEETSAPVTPETPDAAEETAGEGISAETSEDETEE